MKSSCFFFSVDSFPVENLKHFNQPNLPLLFRCWCVGSAYQKDAKRRGPRSVRRDAFPSNVTQLIDGYFVGKIVSSTGLFIFENRLFLFPFYLCGFLFHFNLHFVVLGFQICNMLKHAIILKLILFKFQFILTESCF